MENMQKLLADLLGREAITPDHRLLGACTKGKSIMVTGAGGSIGSELCRQLTQLKPATIILFERSEYALYTIEHELRNTCGASHEAGGANIVPVLGSIRNRELVEKTIQRYQVDTIYHTAAYKQVPMLEHNVVAGIQNNVFGTREMARAAEKFGIENFILISTDKAVRPVNVMGATKNLAEQIVQAMNTPTGRTRFSLVRFGNVLGSSGSVIPLFLKQILGGGPVTVTHPDVTRYFMTVEEAAQLVIQAGGLSRGGEVFVLDMNRPIRIADMARQMIRLMGFRVCECRSNCHCRQDRKIAISYTGLREGEKLIEELHAGSNLAGTAHPKILRAIEPLQNPLVLDDMLARLEQACSNMDQKRVRQILAEAIDGFGSKPRLLEEAELRIAEPAVNVLAEEDSDGARLGTVSH